ncbi:MAG: carboxypeptidase-like regulatory domain-containing protein [Fimbriiglobus sp.]|jgi:hypothetical protein|nr:carboxypeptidase-like regulatory domain-containing protein [Fimbriiglobus sp.]
MMTRFQVFAASAFLGFCLSGCGVSPAGSPNGVEVGGKALLPNGNPLSGGTLVLRGEGNPYGATSQIQPDGKFSLVNSAGEKKVVPGKYRVYVTFHEPAHAAHRTAIGKRYQSSEDGESDVLIEISEAKSDLIIRFKK